MANFGAKTVGKPSYSPRYGINYIKGERALLDSAPTLEAAKAKIENRLAKRHNKGESAEVYFRGELVFATH